ncbi:DUF1186 domain-containing protein [Brunnivagina elsteri]|uniref:Uncharacterized protein n=1 Tax=Brunnivagina elsteri CCALA 953 TaxID=987040 RepID=A0A2A2TI16_9CYAN|nr:DUF1186 domain-containing protein [Calothrix elsteri]PAX53268.1 hypothetical protein CK510_14885 [Calothrix elsteri CCALA 953]
MMNNKSYQQPVDKLLTLGLNTGTQQHDYIVEFGLTSQHIPDLIRMGCDRALLNADSGSLDTWAVIHAWLALGQLRTEDTLAELTAGITPLIQLFHELEDNDLVSEEFPKFFSSIGTVAISPLASYLADESHKLFSRVNAINSLEEIAQKNENARNDCILVLTQQLENYKNNSPELNGFIVAALINLKGKSSASAIKLAFAENQVAEDIVGSWEEVKESLGITSDDELQKLQVDASEEVIEVVTFAMPMIEIPVPISAVDIETEARVNFPDMRLTSDSNTSNNSSVEINTVEELPIEIQDVMEVSTDNSEEANIINHSSSIIEEVLEENTSNFDVMHEVEMTVEEVEAEVNVVEGIGNLPTTDINDNTSTTEIREDANFVDTKLIELKEKEGIRGFGKVGNIKDKDKDKDKSKQKKKKRNFVDL